MIFESHAHFDDDAFDEDRESLIGSLQENRIEYVINVGASMESTESTYALAKKYPFIYAAVGVHPSDTLPLTEADMDRLKELAADEKVVAIGEIGLDYYWDEPEREIQKKWFQRQIELAQEVDLPIIIHSREAAKDTMDILHEHDQGNYRGVMHCFSYSPEVAKEVVKMGFYIGVGGVCTYKNAKKLVEVVEEIPLEYILLETDCPYLTPVPYRGKRNSSLYLPYVVEKIAEIKGVSAEEVERITYENAKKLFLTK